MALHMLRSAPSFTISLRGYDKEEVDEYVDSLRDGHDVDAEALEEAGATIARLEDENSRLAERANDLESCLRVETPRSIFALGQRLTLILEQAEDAAGETVAQANEEAERLVAEATASADATLRHAAQQAAEAEERATTLTRSSEERAATTIEVAEARAAAVTRMADERAATVTKEAETRAAAVTLVAEETARRTGEEAQRKAEAVLAGAEARASARSEEMEAWAERMHAHLCQERDKAAEEFARVWEQRQADLRQLADRRAELVTSLDAMRAALHETVDAARSTEVVALVGTAELSDPEGPSPDGGSSHPVVALEAAPESDLTSPPAEDVTGELVAPVVLSDGGDDDRPRPVAMPVAVPGTQALSGMAGSPQVTVDDGDDELDGWAASWRVTDTGA
jgi:DivIVA domain-containing protein